MIDLQKFLKLTDNPTDGDPRNLFLARRFWAVGPFRVSVWLHEKDGYSFHISLGKLVFQWSPWLRYITLWYRTDPLSSRGSSGFTLTIDRRTR